MKKRIPTDNELLGEINEAYLGLHPLHKKVVRAAAKAIIEALQPWTPTDEDIMEIQVTQAALLRAVEETSLSDQSKVMPHIEKIIAEQNMLLDEIESLRGGARDEGA